MCNKMLADFHKNCVFNIYTHKKLMLKCGKLKLTNLSISSLQNILL